MGNDGKDARRSARLRYPEGDTEFWEWFDAQERPLASIRLLVSKEIAAHGIRDTFWAHATDMTKKES